MEIWKKNLYVVFFAQMIVVTGMTFVIPFLPFYVKELGISNIEQAARWSGWLMGAPALSMIIVSPFWGSLADRVGRKPMIERAIFGGAISIFMMALVTNVYQLLIIRIIQGVLTGSVAACTALVSANSPSRKMGFSLGLLQTGFFLGNFLGPLLGGISADILGFRNSFRITAALLFIAGWLIFFLVEENFTPSVTKKQIMPFKKRVALFFNNGQLFIMFFILFLVQFSIQIISPIFPLFVETIVSNPKIVSTFTGLMFAITGLMSAFSAINVGKLIEKKPSNFLLTISLLGTGLFFLSHAFVTNTTQLILLRVGLGLFYGAIIPIANTIIGLSTPSEHRGKVFGVANSTTYLGSVLGPSSGAFIMITFSLPAVFIFTGGLLLLAGLALP
ncbi:MAG: MFS transporter, partial [Candidatus Atribacteria bacterium]|nr:MFS transporter [Candidatus Atribacteria bacterium]